MENITLPPGFRFHPTDVELIMYYLKRKVTGRKFPPEAKRAIPEVNIRLYAPWELPGQSRSKDLEWYFFCPIERKYASGSRSKRANETGYWKATGIDRIVTYKGRTVGMIKTLVFYQGHSRRGTRTDWLMHEYRMEDKQLPDAEIVQKYVICKVFEKTGSGPKNGSQYGGPFIEEDWDNDDVFAEPDLSGVAPAMLALTDYQSCPVVTSMVDIDSTSSFAMVEPDPSSAEPGSSLATTSELPPGDDIYDLLRPFFTGDDDSLPIEGNNSENMSNVNQERSVEVGECNNGDGIYNGLGDLGNLPTLGEDRYNFPYSWAAEQPPNIPNIGLVDPVIPLNDNTETAYLELNDLLRPLDDDSNCGSETHHLLRHNLYPSYNIPIDVEHSHFRGNNEIVPGQSGTSSATRRIHPKGN